MNTIPYVLATVPKDDVATPEARLEARLETTVFAPSERTVLNYRSDFKHLNELAGVTKRSSDELRIPSSNGVAIYRMDLTPNPVRDSSLVIAGEYFVMQSLNRGVKVDRKKSCKKYFFEPDFADPNFVAPDLDVRDRTGVLSREEEVLVFRRFNWLRYKLLAGLDSLKRVKDKYSSIERLVDLDEALREARSKIVGFNPGLVPSMLKTIKSNCDLSDLISDANMALLDAVDRFDYKRGFKFSTYACNAIRKRIFRTDKRESGRIMKTSSFDPKLQRSDFLEMKRAEDEDYYFEQLKLVVDNNEAGLTDNERFVLESRGYISGKDSSTVKLSLDEIGGRLKTIRVIVTEHGKERVIRYGVSKERVRQIEAIAIKKVGVALRARTDPSED